MGWFTWVIQRSFKAQHNNKLLITRQLKQAPKWICGRRTEDMAKQYRKTLPTITTFVFTPFLSAVGARMGAAPMKPKLMWFILDALSYDTSIIGICLVVFPLAWSSPSSRESQVREWEPLYRLSCTPANSSQLIVTVADDEGPTLLMNMYIHIFRIHSSKYSFVHLWVNFREN